MRQKIKKIGTILLGMMLVFGIVSPVFAATPTTGSIIIHKYKVEDENLVEFDKNVTGVQQSVPTGATPLSGIVFKIEKVIVTADMNDAEKANVDTTWTARTEVTDSTGTISLTGLPLGVYRITEQPTTLVSKSLDPFLVTIPFVNPDNAEELLYEVHVYPKNTLHGQPEIEKWVSEVGNVSDTLGYTDGAEKKAKFIIDVDVPADIASAGLTSAQGNTYEFKIIDQIDSKLVAPASSDVKLYGIKGSSNPVAVTGSNNFTVSVDQNNTVAITIENGATVDWANYDTIRVEFECSLSEEGKSLANAGKNIDNQAALVYTNSLGHIVYTGYSTPTSGAGKAKVSNTVEVHTTAIRLLKVDGHNNGLTLKGAKFGIYSDEKCNNPIIDANGDAMEAVSGDDGIITFLGLPYAEKGDAYNTTKTTTYYVKELEAPAGYQVYSNVYEVSAGADSAADDAKVMVVNYQKFVLPGTGLTGTDVMIIGMVAMVAGIVGVVCLRKKKNIK